MSGGVWSAASGAAAQLEALDVTSNNLANANTTAYRGEEVVFREYLSKAAPKGTAPVHSTAVASVRTRTNPGDVTPTGRSLDIALKGKSLIALSTQDGERYTRAGNLQVASTGQLATHTGALVLGTNGKPISVPAGQGEPQIAPDGTVTIADNTLGRILLVEFPNEQALERESGGTMKATPASGTPVPSSDGVISNALERPNVSVVQGMIDMVSITRGFDACQKALDAFKDADSKALSLMSPNG